MAAKVTTRHSRKNILQLSVNPRFIGHKFSTPFPEQTLNFVPSLFWNNFGKIIFDRFLGDPDPAPFNHFVSMGNVIADYGRISENRLNGAAVPMVESA